MPDRKMRAFTRENIRRAPPAGRAPVAGIDGIVNRLKEDGFPESAERILELRQIDYSEEGGKPLSLASVKGFARFVNRLKFLGEPAIGVFNEGTLAATWKTPGKQSLLIEFLDADRALFALTRPKPAQPKEKISRSGDNLSHDDLMRKLSENGVGEWRN